MSVEEQRLQEMRTLIQAKRLSPKKEERFERWRNTVGLFLGPLLGLIVYAIPMPSLSDKAHVLAAIITLIATWWITEPIPIPMSAVLGAALCVILGVAGAKQVFAPFVDPIIYLFLGSFILAEAMASMDWTSVLLIGSCR